MAFINWEALNSIIPYKIATLPNINVLYSVTKNTKISNLYIECIDGMHKIYERKINENGIECISLIQETKYNGSSWSKFIRWYCTNKIDKFINDHVIDVVNGMKCDLIQLNVKKCYKICYNSRNLNLKPQECKHMSALYPTRCMTVHITEESNYT